MFITKFFAFGQITRPLFLCKQSVEFKAQFLSKQMSSVTLSHRLKDKVAIVTASTDGIGLAIAKRLALEGAKVVISSRKQKNVDKALGELTKQGLDVSGVVCHVGKEEDRKSLIQHAVSRGGIDILVSNAAANPAFGALLDTPEGAWDKIFETNVKAAFLLTKAAVPHMENKRNPSIVFVSSIGGYRPIMALGAYCVSKTALLGLTQVLSNELSPSIRVNCVAPGIIKTHFSQPLWENQAIADEALKQIPLKRFGDVDEIAGSVAFLCSDDASYITGETLVAAGGFFSRL